MFSQNQSWKLNTTSCDNRSYSLGIHQDTCWHSIFDSMACFQLYYSMLLKANVHKSISVLAHVCNLDEHIHFISSVNHMCSEKWGKLWALYHLYDSISTFAIHFLSSTLSISVLTPFYHIDTCHSRYHLAAQHYFSLIILVLSPSV